MFRFLHSADWQLGARFAQFGTSGDRLRQARLETLGRSLAMAAEHAADAFLIAGDLFEDNQVDDALVADVLALFGRHPDLPIHILPGNHDPHTGPESVWQRKAFLRAGPNVHVHREAGAVDLGAGVRLLAAPLHQKQSTTDPSLQLVEIAAGLPSDILKIGLTHGAPAIESRHQPNDFPIALNAATRAGLDYLAIGHWHNWLDGIDGGRVVMPGTPEPDRFGNDDSGHVALVEIDGPGGVPRVRKLPVATLTWRALVFDGRDPEVSRAGIDAALGALVPKADRTVVRVTLTGTVSPAVLGGIRGWLEPALEPFLVGQVRDETRVALTAAELADLRVRHPILAQVLADIDRLEAFAVGASPAGSGSADPGGDAGPDPLTLAEAQALLAGARIDLAQLPAGWFGRLRQTLLQTFQEVFA